MGTVGISFGSPTSGTGFDVNATVSSIVTNLQKIETPWKNQLSSLQGQDTALSSLGAQFSKLSQDLNELTQFQGVLAQKTGSSSNTNVLQLSSASASANAGTHTVLVNDLAQTSSGYFDATGSVDDPLTGSVIISPNGGTARSFDLASMADPNRNLSGLAAAINAAGIGVIASVLTDSDGSRLSLVSGISGAKGQLNVTSTLLDAKSATASNPIGALAYHGSVQGKDASLTIDGVPLLSGSNTASNLIPGVTFQLLSSSSAGSEVQVVIGNDNSGVENAIASMVSDYNTLIGAIGAQEGVDSSGNAQPLFGSPTLSLLQQQLLGSLNGQNPNGYLDAIANSTDTLAGSISIQVGSGTARAVNLPAGGGTLSDLASAINSAKIGVSANLMSNSTGTRLVLVSGTAGSAGTLTVSSTIADLTNSNTQLNYNANSSSISSLSSLGISVNNDGTLTLDANVLDSLLNTDFRSVVGFFQDANSWGMNFSNMLGNAGSTSSKGIIALAERSNGTVEENLNASIAKEEGLIALQQKSLTAELNKANQILQSLPDQLNSVDMIYSAITGYNSSRR